MEKIKSVIFDWGGVLIDEPVPALMQYCADALGVSKEDYIKAHRKFGEDFQKGQISEDTFWARVCGELNVAKPKSCSLWKEAFEAVYSPKEKMFALARSLCERGYRTAFLSNTEIPAMRFFYQQGYDMFDVFVFIDDKPEHIKGAQETGLNTILFKSVEQVKTELSLLGIKAD